MFADIDGDGIDEFICFADETIDISKPTIDSNN